MFVAQLVLRWLHIIGAMIIVGGTFFMRFGYYPGLATRSEEEQSEIQAAMIAQWRKWVMMSSGFLLISGLANVAILSMNFKPASYYHPVMGIKVLLALAVFFISARLVGRSESAAEMRKNGQHWLNINLALAIIVVALAGVMKLADRTPKEKAESAQVTLSLKANGYGQKSQEETRRH